MIIMQNIFFEIKEISICETIDVPGAKNIFAS